MAANQPQGALDMRDDDYEVGYQKPPEKYPL